MNKASKKILSIALPLFTIFVLSCSFINGKWSLFYYPDPGNIPDATKIQEYIVGTYPTFNDCQAAGIALVRQHNEGVYICGLNCEPNPELDNLLICKETRK